MIERLARGVVDTTPVGRAKAVLRATTRDLAQLLSASGSAKPIALPATLAHASESTRALDVHGWSTEGLSRATLTWIDLSPGATRFELVAVPRGPMPTLLVRLEVDPLGTGRLLVDAFGPGAPSESRLTMAPFVRDLAAASATLGPMRPSPRYVRALSSGGGVVRTRALARAGSEVSALVTRYLVLAAAHAHEPRGAAFDAAGRTMADALRAHDKFAIAARLRFGAAVDARLDTFRFSP